MTYSKCTGEDHWTWAESMNLAAKKDWFELLEEFVVKMGV